VRTGWARGARADTRCRGRVAEDSGGKDLIGRESAMALVKRKAAWRVDTPADGWSEDWRWYAAAMARMKALTPGLDEFRLAFGRALSEADPRSGELPQARLDQLTAIIAGWSNPLSLGYQSQVHGTFALDRSSWPRHQGRKVLWRECAHDQWFFLPWHRAYLLQFEMVVRQHIEELDGPADTWALPYWNYSDFASDRRALGLPLALRTAVLPDGVEVPGLEADPGDPVPNPLFEPTRQATGDPEPGESTSWADAGIALRRSHFANQQDTRSVSFGGGVIDDPDDTVTFHRGGERGQLDAQPHGMTHGHVGGFMWLFETAALDPAFWVHHCNVDRLWETYSKDLDHGYPFEAPDTPASAARTSWTEHALIFLLPDGSLHSWTAAEVTDIGALGYAYDTTAAPALPPLAPAPPGSEIDPFGVAPEGTPEPVAGTSGIQLDGTTRVTLTSGGGVPAGALLAASFPADTRWLLRLTGVRSAGVAPTSFDVFLGLDPADLEGPTDPADPRYCGGLSLFGAFEATRDDGISATNGIMQVFDVTEQVRSLGGDFAIDGAQVTLVPVHPGRDLTWLSVEQITLEFA